MKASKVEMLPEAAPIDSNQLRNMQAVVIELLFVFVEAVFVAPRTKELGIAT